MIWYFLAGFIAGVVGVLMFLGWWLRSHVKRVTAEEMLNDLRKAGYPEGNGAGDSEGKPVSEPDRDADGTGGMESGTEQRVADKEQGESAERG